MSLHRALIPHRDEIRDFSVATAGMLPDFSAHQLHEYSDRVTGLVDDIDDLRQRVTDAMQSYSASVSNIQAGVINRLTIISAVFLPLTFLTGFFGMNFQWMIDRIDSREAFFGMGIGLFSAVLALVLWLFWRLGWLGVKRPATGNAGVRLSSGGDSRSPLRAAVEKRPARRTRPP
jgi:magnesium transporter